MNEFKDYSQNGETKILVDLFEKIGITNMFFVEFGAGDGYHLSNCAGLRDLGWNGLMMDLDNRGNPEVKQEFITKENILHLFEKYQVPELLDLLSIDIDGNDYHVLKEILQVYEPNVIICEINSQLDLDKSIVMPYNPAHVWDGSNAYGMSYLACFKLLEEYDYMVYDVVNNTNVIAIHNVNAIKHKGYVIGKTCSHPEKDIYWQTV